MNVKSEKIEDNKVKVQFTIGVEAFEAAQSKAFAANKDKFSVPGFRKGKAPRAIVEKHYGENVLFEDAFDIAFPAEYLKAVEELNIEPVSHPEIDIASFDKEKGIEVTALVYVRPEVKLGKYQGIKVKKKVAKVGEKDVDAELASMLDKAGRFEDVSDEAKDGDRVVIDYSGSVDGVKFSGGTAEKQPLLLGSHTFIPGFEEQIAGLKIGGEKDITVKFPEEYHAKELAGKDAVFAVKLHEIKRKHLPELDDEFAKDVSEFDTLSALKDDLKAKLQQRADDKAKTDAEDEVLKKIVDDCKVTIPQPMIETQIDRQIQQFEYNLMYQGIKLEDYLKYTDTKMEDLRAQYKESAESLVKSHLAIEAIMAKENIAATDGDVEEFIKKAAENAKKTPEDYKKVLGEEGMENVRSRIALDNTLKFIFDGIVYE